MKIKKPLLWTGAVLLIVALDRVVKIWAERALSNSPAKVFVPKILNLHYTTNDGAAFSIFSGNRIFLTVVTIAALFVIGFLLIKRVFPHALSEWALVLVAGGAIGNLIDRAWKGYVVDMFEFSFVNFAIFNVADIFVTAGGVMLIVYLLFLSPKDEKKEAGEAL